MNTLVLMMALVGLSFLSGIFGRGRSIRGLGLPSGAEWVILGFLLGPDLLGAIDRPMQLDIEPVLYVAVGWVGLVLGLDYGVVRSRRLRRGRIALGVFLGLVTVAAVAGAAWFLAPYLGAALSPRDRLVLALGLGAVGSETTSNAVRWVAERHGALGPLSELLDDLAEAKDVVPIVAAGIGLCLHPRFEIPHAAASASLIVPGAVLVTAALLGGICSIMLRREERSEQSWGIIVGIALLAAGTTARLGLPVITALFTIGLVIGVSSRHRDRLVGMIDPTKRSALLPVLLLAGARIAPGQFARYGLVVAGVVLARAAVLHVIGLGVARLVTLPSPERRLGLAMLPAGELTISIGLSFALVFPGAIGEAVLLSAAVVTLLGEAVGPIALRAALRRAGELRGATLNSGEYPVS
jgi:Kef-type K+ transport system membrane component KefB